MKLDYVYIRAWDAVLGSTASWTEEQIAKARRDAAPEDAIYWDEREKRWHRFADIANDRIKLEMKDIIERLQLQASKTSKT